jgi:hypothetical protein
VVDQEPTAERRAPRPRRAAEVLRFFLNNPHAADSLEGVVRWRLLRETIHRSVTEVDEALHWLVEQQLLITQTAPGVAPIFSLNNSRVREAQALVADETSEPK